MSGLITRTVFTCELITIRSKKSFSEVTKAIERLFQQYDFDIITDFIQQGSSDNLKTYVEQIGQPTGFGIFFQLDEGPIQRLLGLPIETRFYLFGNAATAQGLFRFSAAAGLGAPVRFCVSQRDGEETRIDIDLPTSFFSQFPEMRDSSVPAELDRRMVPLLEGIAA